GAPVLRRAAVAGGAVSHTPWPAPATHPRGGGGAGLVTEHGEVEAGTVVCAAGAWTSRLLRPLGVSLPVLWTRSSVARTTPVHPITPLGVWAKVAFRQRRDGSLNIALGGRTDCDITTDSLRWGRYFAPLYWQKRRAVTVRLGKPLWDDLRGHYTPGKSLTLDPAAHPARVAAALATLKASFPHRADLQDAAITTTWAGYIDCTPDMVPVIDAPSTPGNLLIATGMSGHGFGLGPGVGKAVAEWIDRGTTTFDLTPFRLGRFAEPGPHRPRAVI
ncbi:MAG: NAD(P)/FAD-dependent oxidoreductase, partial [Candidatus Competibacterales bacterium]